MMKLQKVVDRKLVNLDTLRNDYAKKGFNTVATDLKMTVYSREWDKLEEFKVDIVCGEKMAVLPD